MTMSSNNIEQENELEALSAIYADDLQIESKTSFSIKLTNDLKLYINYNEEYPSNKPPVFTLFAPYLSTETKREIGKTFQDIFEKDIGCPVVFAWVEAIRELVDSKKDASEESGIVNEENEEVEPKNYNIIHGPTITDRKSTFQGHACSVHSLEEMKDVYNKILENKKVQQATHNILAYRIRTGERFIQDCDSDGENQAGGRLLHLLEVLNVENIMVIVTRWYGGIHLGPDRFRHINDAGRAVLKEGNFI